MSFTDHKITAFAHKIADLPDEPQLPAADLKSRFDACPEELRQSLNAVCDDADRLEARVEGIIVDTFGDTIDKEMLSDELAAELDGMADGIEALGDSLDQLDTQKCEVYFGTYTGNEAFGRHVDVGFAAKAVLIVDVYATNESTGQFTYCGLGLQGNPLGVQNFIELDATGFTILGRYGNNDALNAPGHYYAYLAFK